MFEIVFIDGGKKPLCLLTLGSGCDRYGVYNTGIFFTFKNEFL